jgi:hypothetical protein
MAYLHALTDFVAPDLLFQDTITLCYDQKRKNGELVARFVLEGDETWATDCAVVEDPSFLPTIMKREAEKLVTEVARKTSTDFNPTIHGQTCIDDVVSSLGILRKPL